MAQNSFSIGVYCRLSKDDNDYHKESASISNQKRLLTDHVQENGWNIWEIYMEMKIAKMIQFEYINSLIKSRNKGFWRIWRTHKSLFFCRLKYTNKYEDSNVNTLWISLNPLT